MVFPSDIFIEYVSFIIITSTLIFQYHDTQAGRMIYNYVNLICINISEQLTLHYNHITWNTP